MASLHTWVINLDRAPERLVRIGARLDTLGLPWSRFSAVEGKLLTAEDQAQLLDRPGFERRHGMTPTLGELGCYVSHVRVMQAFLDSGHDFALILEDDVHPHGGPARGAAEPDGGLWALGHGQALSHPQWHPLGRA